MSFFDDIHTRTSLEGHNQALTLKAVSEFLAGERTHAGPRVTEKSSLKLSVVFACIRVIAETLGSLPAITYRRLHPRGKERARRHPNYRLIRHDPNPEMTAMTFWETIAAHAVSWGGGFAEKEIAQDGRILALWPLLPDRTKALRKGGRKVIRTRVPTRRDTDGTKSWQTVDLPAERVLHIPGLGFDGLNGYSVIGMARQSIGWGLGLEQFSARYFGSGTHPDLVIQHPEELSDPAADRLRSSIQQWNQGLERSHRLLLLEEGMSAEKIGIPPNEAQFIETRVSVDEIVARFFRMQHHKIGLLQRATFNNIEHQSIEFVTDTIRPWCVRFEQAIHRSLFSPREQSEYFVEFLIDGLLRGDMKSRFEAYSQGLQNGVYSRNEVREMENRNPIPGEAGDAYTVQLNMASLDSLLQLDLGQRAAQGPTAALRALGEVLARALGQREGEEGSERAGLPEAAERRVARSIEARRRHRVAFRAVFERAASHFVNRESRAALRWLGRAFESPQPLAELETLMGEFYATFPEAIVRELLPVLESYAAVVGSEISAEVGPPLDAEGARVQMATFLGLYAAAYADRHVASSRRQVAALAAEHAGEALEQALEERFQEWETERPRRIARDETIRAEGAIAEESYAQAGRSTKRWRTVGEDCPLCQRLDGKEVGIREVFVAAGETISGVDGSGKTITVRGIKRHPPLHRGCDCFLTS